MKLNFLYKYLTSNFIKNEHEWMYTYVYLSTHERVYIFIYKIRIFKEVTKFFQRSKLKCFLLKTQENIYFTL